MIQPVGTHSHLFGKPKTKCMGCSGPTVLAYCDICAGLDVDPAVVRDDRRRNGEPNRRFACNAKPGTAGGMESP